MYAMFAINGSNLVDTVGGQSKNDDHVMFGALGTASASDLSRFNYFEL